MGAGHSTSSGGGQRDGHSTPTTCEMLHAHSWSSLHDLGSVKSETHSVGGTLKKKSRNLASLVTLKKKFVRKARRVSKTFDHGQILRDFLTGWSSRDLMLLVEEYEATGLLKELSYQAEIARPSASTVARDLAELYDFKYASDSYLLFRGVHFPVHKAIICVRCPFFRELLGKVNTFGARVAVNIDIPGLRPELFNDLLRYLYSGELSPTIRDTPPSLPSYDSILLRLSEQFGVPNELDYDLKRLLETGLYSDACLVFSNSTNVTPTSDYCTAQTKKCRACSDQAEYSCHTSVLASRSPFFRNVIQRHQRRFADADSGLVNTANQKIRIVLDESIIPRRFARVILHSMYRDATDLLAVLPHCVCKCYQYSMISLDGTASASASGVGGAPYGGSTTSLGGSSIASGHSSNCSTLPGSSQSIMACHHAQGASGGASSSAASNTAGFVGLYVKEIMDLFEIARFLELDSLIQSCEDMIVDSLSVDTLASILKWSEQAHGSPWVKRQALHYLREEYAAIANSNALFGLEPSHLLEAVKSDFTQASELEILSSVIKWGEQRLIKRMEEREPNVVSQTAHSLRRGHRRRELNDTELRDIIAEIMGHVRIGQVLPLDCDALTSAAKRGLISTLPPYMLGEDLAIPYVRGISLWLRGCSTPFLRPRYFTPYVEEAKAYLEERLSRPGEMIPAKLDMHRGGHMSKQIPDTLYMLDDIAEHSNLMMMQSSFSQFPACDAGHQQPQQHSSRHQHHHKCPSSSGPLTSGNSTASVAYSSTGSHLEPATMGSTAAKTPSSGDRQTLGLELPTGHSSTRQSALPIIEQRILVLMKQREQELKTRALSNGSLAVLVDRSDINKLIQLRTVREFGLPDRASEVLANTAAFMPYPMSETTETEQTDEMTASYGLTVLSNLGSNCTSDKADNIYDYLSGGGPTIASEPAGTCRSADSPIPPIPHPFQMSSMFEQYDLDDDRIGGTRHLNDLVPDIAMATSALAELHLLKRSTESLHPPPPQMPNFEGHF